MFGYHNRILEIIDNFQSAISESCHWLPVIDVRLVQKPLGVPKFVCRQNNFPFLSVIFKVLGRTIDQNFCIYLNIYMFFLYWKNNIHPSILFSPLLIYWLFPECVLMTYNVIALTRFIIVSYLNEHEEEHVE